MLHPCLCNLINMMLDVLGFFLCQAVGCLVSSVVWCSHWRHSARKNKYRDKICFRFFVGNRSGSNFISWHHVHQFYTIQDWFQRTQFLPSPKIELIFGPLHILLFSRKSQPVEVLPGISLNQNPKKLPPSPPTLQRSALPPKHLDVIGAKPRQMGEGTAGP